MNEGIHLDLDTWIVPGQIRVYLDNNNNKRPLTPKSMPPAGDEHAKPVYLIYGKYDDDDDRPKPRT